MGENQKHDSTHIYCPKIKIMYHFQSINVSGNIMVT